MASRVALDPYSVALAMLARRELSTSQVRGRLRRKNYSTEAIEVAVHRLRQTGALNDERTAIASARQSAIIKLHGRRRALQKIESLGINGQQAHAAVNEVFDEVDEQDLLERALARRLHGRITDRAQFRRLYQYLIRQGFDGSMAVAALKARDTPT